MDKFIQKRLRPNQEDPQLGIFWIATAWLATGLYVAPAVSGREPRFQKLGVDFLWSCLVLIVVGTLFGTWYSTRQQMGLEMSFWFGHQGYEYVDLGRFWQIFLFVGAGLFGFLINPPVALYYMQGLNTTPVHGHTALFGVYGMLGLGLALFCLRGLSGNRPWRTGSLALVFWSLNAGLVLMVVLSLLPVGLAQTWASMQHGLWYARSAEFLMQDWLVWLRWLRVVGDVVFATGILALVWFVAGLWFGWSIRGGEPDRLQVMLPEQERVVR